MPKCPKCGAEINYLVYSSTYKEEAFFSINEYGDTEYERLEEIEYMPDSYYRCPKCGETLFLDEEEAEKFLRGEEVETAEE